MIQDASKDPYDSIRKSQEEQKAAAPGKGDLVSGLFPGRKLSDGPALVNASGQILETPSGKERRELRQQQKDMRAVQLKVHTQTFTQECQDDVVRMMWKIINENPATGRKTVLMEFGYRKDQLQDFINAIEEHESEIQKEEREAGSATPPPETPDA
jgi:hypothetical protein